MYENPHRELEVTPLMVACLIGELEAVQTLVENKANVNYGSEVFLLLLLNGMAPSIWVKFRNVTKIRNFAREHDVEM